MKYCSIKGCGSKGKGIKMHCIPKSREKEWVNIIRKNQHDFIPTKNTLVCCNHFLEEDYVVGGAYDRKILKKDAIPCIFLVTDPNQVSVNIEEDNISQCPLRPESTDNMASCVDQVQAEVQVTTDIDEQPSVSSSPILPSHLVSAGISEKFPSTNTNRDNKKTPSVCICESLPSTNSNIDNQKTPVKKGKRKFYIGDFATPADIESPNNRLKFWYASRTTYDKQKKKIKLLEKEKYRLQNEVKTLNLKEHKKLDNKKKETKNCYSNLECSSEITECKQHGVRCSLDYCHSHWSNRKERAQTKFFCFPEDVSRCAKWIEKCFKYLPTINPVTLHKNHQLCSLHFEDRMYSSSDKSRLKSDAIPTLFHKDITMASQNHSVLASQEVNKNISNGNIISFINLAPCLSSDSSIILSTSVPGASTSNGIITDPVCVQPPLKLMSAKKRLADEFNSKELEKIVIELRRQLEQSNTVENCLKMCEIYLPPTLFMLVKNHLLNKDKDLCKQQHSNDIKEFCLTIYRLGPKVFRFLQKLLSLPSIETLMNSQNELSPIHNDHRYSRL